MAATMKGRLRRRLEELERPSTYMMDAARASHGSGGDFMEVYARMLRAAAHGG